MPGGAAVELEIAMPQYRYVALASKWFNAVRSGARLPFTVARLQISRFFQRNRLPAATNKNRPRYLARHSMEVLRIRKALAVLATVATVGATTVSAPAQARGWGWGPGIGIGLAVGALAAGAAYGAYGPYGYGPGYGYYGYGPRYYGPAYYGYYGRPYYGPGYGPYAYYGGPYYRYGYWRHW